MNSVPVQKVGAVRSAFSRLSGFSLAVLLPAAAGFAVIPILIRVGGQDGWSAIAVGQSAGTVAGLVVALGWGFNGPTLIARAHESEHSALALNSLVARSLFAPAAIGLACGVAALLRPNEMLVSALSCLGVALLGMGFTWMFIGSGNVRALLALDALPRVVASVVGVVVLVLSRDVLGFVLCQLAGAVLSVGASAIYVIDGRAPRESWGIRTALVQTRSQVSAGVTVLTAAAYLSMPTLIIAALAPGSVFVYALADRLTRFTFMAIAPIYQWMQGWVPSAESRPQLFRRIRKATQISSIVAVVLALAIVVFGPTAAQVLGDETGLVTWHLTVPLAVSVAMSALSRCFGMVCLLALHRERDVAISAVLGAVCGVPLLLLLVPTGGAVGAAGAVMISESVVAVFQAYKLRTALHTGSAGDAVSLRRTIPNTAE